MIFFALLSALGLIASSAAHFRTYFGMDAEQAFPLVGFLHLGMFLVLIPAAMIRQRKGTKREFSWRDMTGNAPAWMRWLIFLCLANAVISGVAFSHVCGKGGPTREPDGTCSISSHGRIIRRISFEEYQRDSAYDFRAFSCWWMLCYSFTLTLFVSEINRRKRAYSSATCH
jgi:hypothetical protein